MARYKTITIHDHPLAMKGGHVLLHRAVLYGKIGPGEHSCHWCGKIVSWGTDLVSDHVDGDETNNNPGNLVPSCQGCNFLRTRGWRIMDGELYLIKKDGVRVRAIKIICKQCGKEKIKRHDNGSEFCSSACSHRYNATGHTMISIQCEHCGVEVKKRKAFKPRFCSRSCAWKAYWSNKNSVVIK